MRTLKLFGLSAVMAFLVLTAGTRSEGSFSSLEGFPLYVWEPPTQPVFTLDFWFSFGWLSTPVPPPKPELVFEGSKPYVLIRTRVAGSSGNWATFFALVDSGADSSLFPKGLASSLGIDLTKGKELRAAGVWGKPMRVWEHQLEVVIYCNNKELNKMGISCKPEGEALPIMRIGVLFPEFDQDQGNIPLLGRTGVLDNITATLEARKLTVRAR